MIKFLGYLGAGFMIAFSWSMIIPLALAGLLLLTIEAMDNKQWNLVALNICSILGLIYKIIT